MARSDKPINPETGIWYTRDWGSECARGFVRSEMFARAGDRVIKPTSRVTTRKWRKLAGTERAAQERHEEAS